MTAKQRGVLKGMITGLSVSVLAVVWGYAGNPLGFTPDIQMSGRLTVMAAAMSVPLIFMVISVARLARHRFFTPEDIDGSGLTVGSGKAHVLQSLLQNTLEQAVISGLVYVVWAVLMPGETLSVIVLAAGLFFLGRVLFFAGYEKGAPGRALGFTLSFYPSAVMLLVFLLHTAKTLF